MSNAQMGISPFIKKLAKYEGSFKTATTAKNPRAGITAPDGTYMVKVRKLFLSEIGKKGGVKDPCLKITTIIICAAEVEGFPPGDMTYQGEQAGILHTIRETEKRTVEQCWESIMFDLQDLGIETSPDGNGVGGMILHEGVRTDAEQFTFEQAIDFLNNRCDKKDPEYPDGVFCMLAITTGSTGYKNANLRGQIPKSDVDQAIGGDSGGVADDVTHEDEPPAEGYEEVDTGETGLVADGNVTTAEVEGGYEEVDNPAEQLGELPPEPVAAAPAAAPVRPAPPRPGAAGVAPAATAPRGPAVAPPRPGLNKPAVAAPKAAAPKPGPAPAAPAAPAVKGVPGKRPPGPAVKR